MSHALRRLSKPSLERLREALHTKRLRPPYSRASLGEFAQGGDLDALVGALKDLDEGGMTPANIEVAIDLLVEERGAAQAMTDRLAFVWSPPEMDQVDYRDTSVVVQDLFRHAKHSVLIVTYAIDHGTRAEAIFGALAKRMDNEPGLSVRVIVNVMRPYLDTTDAKVLTRTFADKLRDHIWPGTRLPEVFFDPRSLEEESQHSVMHAKCVVIDKQVSFITSANFTEAAQVRNIELGVRIDDAKLAERIVLQFDRLIEKGQLTRLVFGPAKIS
jgi:phosphatidylserine/phosphatidylglycerophosphate/cardiolipin synthase-like enzyme